MEFKSLKNIETSFKPVSYTHLTLPTKRVLSRYACSVSSFWWCVWQS